MSSKTLFLRVPEGTKKARRKREIKIMNFTGLRNLLKESLKFVKYKK